MRRWREPNYDWPTVVPCPATPAATDELLRTGQVLSAELIPWGSNYTFLVALSHGTEPGLLAVYKPRRGEAPLWDFPDGTLYRRERAAYLVAAALGWDFIPPTIVRDGPHGVGSMQVFVETPTGAARYEFGEDHREQLTRIALYDLLTNNADRKAGHCLLGINGQVWGIDHGLTFHTEPKLRTVLWEFYEGEIPATLLTEVQCLLADDARSTELRAQLRGLLAKDEVQGFFQRAERVVERGQYPSRDRMRARPWPFY